MKVYRANLKVTVETKVEKYLATHEELQKLVQWFLMKKRWRKHVTREEGIDKV